MKYSPIEVAVTLFRDAQSVLDPDTGEHVTIGGSANWTGNEYGVLVDLHPLPLGMSVVTDAFTRIHASTLPSLHLRQYHAPLVPVSVT